MGFHPQTQKWEIRRHQIGSCESTAEEDLFEWWYYGTFTNLRTQKWEPYTKQILPGESTATYEQSTTKYEQTRWYHVKVLLKRFHLNAHTIGFHLQTQKLKPRTNQMEPYESTAEEVSIQSSHHTVFFNQKRRSYYPFIVDRRYNELKGQGWWGGTTSRLGLGAYFLLSRCC